MCRLLAFAILARHNGAFDTLLVGAMPTSQELIAHARAQYQGGDRVRAEQLCWEALRLEPLHPDAIYLLGAISREAGGPFRALLHWPHAVTPRPADASFRHALGEAYRTVGRPAEAIACFREALRLEPGNAGTHHALGLAHLDQ